MTPVWLRVRTNLRRRWLSWVVIGVLIAVVGGAVLTVAAGARRTDTAYPRYLASSDASDLFVSPANTGLPSYYAALGRLPGVALVGRLAGINAQPAEAQSATPGGPVPAVQVVAPLDGHIGFDLDRPRVLTGRMFRPDAPDEAVVDRSAARALHLRVGSALTLAAFKNNPGPSDPPGGRRLTYRVVGVVVDRTKVVSLTRVDGQPRVEVGPAAANALGPDYFGFDGAFVRLARGASADRLAQAAEALATRYPETGSGPVTVVVSKQADQAARVEQSIRPLALALGLFALIAAVAFWLIVGQFLSRQLFLVSNEHPVLRALGLTRVQLMAVGLAEVGLPVVAGALVAVVISIVASPLTPMGPARLAEPHPGVAVNVALLGIGLASIVLLLLARVVWPAWRYTDAGPRVERPSAASEVAARLNMPPSATVGLRLALEPGGGDTAIPVRTTLFGAALSLATLATALVFGANLSRLVHTPQLYGQSWNLAVDGQFVTLPTEQVVSTLRRQPNVVAWSFGDYGSVTIRGRDVSAIGVDRGSGAAVFPTLLQGRAPAGPDEIVLGSKVLQRIHGRVGQTVPVTLNGTTMTMRVVGRAVFPDFGRGSFVATDLGEGAAVSADLLPQLGGSADLYNFVLVRFAPGAARPATTAHFVNDLSRIFSCTQDNGNCQIFSTQPPAVVLNYARIETTPVVLAAMLAAVGMLTLAHLLVVSANRRRRDLAMLKTLGFVGRQVSATVAWQASAVAVVALILGLPVGVATGRWLWSVFASNLGVATEPAVPLLAIALSVPAALLLANLVAAVPGRMVRRLKPSIVLRGE